MAQTKQQKELVLLVVLLLVAGLVWHFYFGKHGASYGAASVDGNYTPINAEDYSFIIKEMREAQSTEYKSSGRNIFIAGPATVTQEGNKAVEVKPSEPARLLVGPTLPSEIPPPQLSMKFFGYGTTQPNGVRRAFLEPPNGDPVLIVQEGDIVQNHIRITHIGNDRIEYEDTVTGKKNSSNLELPPAA